MRGADWYQDENHSSCALHSLREGHFSFDSVWDDKPTTISSQPSILVGVAPDFRKFAHQVPLLFSIIGAISEESKQGAVGPLHLNNIE